MATKIVTKNSSTASAVPTASDLVQGELAVNVADKRLFTEDNAGAIVELGTNPSGNVTFQDNGKAIFGAGDDLQIYHDGSNSYINDAGTGNLYLRASNAIIMQSADGAETIASFHDDNLCRLYFDNAIKLATTSTGIDVTGNVTMATGGSIVAGGVNDLILNAGESGTPDIYLQSGSSTKVKIEGSNGNVGIGNIVASSMNAGANQLVVGSGSAGQGITLYSSTSTAGSIHFADGTSGDAAYRGQLVYNHNGDYMAMYTAATERMRISNAGILMVSTSADFASGTVDGIIAQGTNKPAAAFSNTASGQIVKFYEGGSLVGNIGTQGGDLYLGTDDANIKFVNSASIQPVNSVGGVRDNAIDIGGSSARFKDLYLSANALVGRTSSLSGQSGSVSANTVVSAHGPLSSHATNAGILEYYNDETLLRSYGANAGSGKLVFKVGGGGGSADSEAMRITSDGKVGIGNSDPKRALVVAASDSAGVQTQYVNTTTGSALGDGFTVGINASEQAEFWNAENTAMLFATNNTERLRIDSAGAISVGSSTQAVTELQLNHENSGGKGELQLNAHGSASFSMLSNFTGSTVNGVATGGFGLITPHSYPISFVTNELERMRIDSSGNLLVGASTFSFAGSSDCVQVSGAEGRINIENDTTSTAYTVAFYNTNGLVGKISTSGSSTNYDTSSDQRLKENIADADDAGSKIDAIQVRKFDWKADGSHQDYGMIAQELLEVAPEAVSQGETEEEMMGVDYSKLVPMLIKEIQSLRNRVAQLEE